MHQRLSDRLRASRERREQALEDLERRLLEELWDTPSQVHDRPSRVHPPVQVDVEEPPPTVRSRGLSTQAKQVITIVSMAVATAIVSALTAMGATKPHELPKPEPKTTQPGP